MKVEYRSRQEDEGLHLLRPLAENKQHGINDIGFATAIWPNHGGKALQRSSLSECVSSSDSADLNY